MRVFLSLLSLCSVTLICCLIISADVIGLLGLAGGTVNDIPGDPELELCELEPEPGDVGADPPPFPHDILLDGDRLIIFNPSALFILLVGVVCTTPFCFDPDPSGFPLLS